MDHVLHERIMGAGKEADSIIKDSAVLDEMSFEDYVLSLISPHIGKTDKELCAMLDLKYTGNKATLFLAFEDHEQKNSKKRTYQYAR